MRAHVIISCLFASLLICSCSASISAETNHARFNVIAFYTGKSDGAHISFVKEANQWFARMGAERGFWSFTFDSEVQNKLILNALEWLGTGKKGQSSSAE